MTVYYFLALILFLQIIVLIKMFSHSKGDPQNDIIPTKLDTFTDRMDLRLMDSMERNSNFERELSINLGQFQETLAQSMNLKFIHQHELLETKLDRIDRKVNLSLEEGFKQSNTTFTNIVQRLSKIDEAQKKIDTLSTNIVSLQDILTDKKSRGTFGEIQLNQILASIFGESNDKLYQTQYNFGSVRVDAVLFAPQPLGLIAIDSKFPLENYQKMLDAHLNSQEYQIHQKAFANDVKKHIRDIAIKYIIPQITSDQAIMFIPSEAVFATINAYHPDIITYSQKNRVWLVSPTTLMSTLTTIQTIVKNMEREKYASIIHQQLQSLGLEFERYQTRWDMLSKRLDGVHKDVKEIHITSDKISKQFANIASNDGISDDSIDQKKGDLHAL